MSRIFRQLLENERSRKDPTLPTARLKWTWKNLLGSLFIFIRKKPVAWCSKRPGEVLLYYQGGYDIFDISFLLPWDWAKECAGGDADYFYIKEIGQMSDHLIDGIKFPSPPKSGIG